MRAREKPSLTENYPQTDQEESQAIETCIGKTTSMNDAIFPEKELEALLVEAQSVIKGSCPGHPDQELPIVEKGEWEADSVAGNVLREESAPESQIEPGILRNA